MRLFRLLLLSLLLNPLTAFALTLQQVEVYLDVDPGTDNGTVQPIVTADSLEEIDFSLSLTGIAAGPHTLYIRVKDDTGDTDEWSDAVGRSVYVVDSTGSGTGGRTDNVLLTESEAFFDVDPGEGNASPLPLVSVNDNLSNIVNQLSLNGLAVGPHTLYTRVKDNTGSWSIAVGRSVYVAQTGDAGTGGRTDNVLVDGAEAYLDTDPGESNGTALSLPLADNLQHIVTQLSLAGISVGNHTLYTRVKDSKGVWSDPIGRSLYVADNSVAGLGQTVTLTGAQVSIDNGTYTGVQAEDSNFDDYVEIVPVTYPDETSAHSSITRFQDNTGLYGYSLASVATLDSDNDGLPDEWELLWFGNLNQGPNDDPDGDGLTNAQEFAQGENPLTGISGNGLTISGTVTNGSGGAISGALMCLESSALARRCNVHTDASGQYVLGVAEGGLPAADYTVEPDNEAGSTAYSFAPNSQNATLTTEFVTGVDFTATPISRDLLLNQLNVGLDDALTFDGVDDQVTVPNTNGLYDLAQWTLETVVLPDASDTRATIISHGGSINSIAKNTVLGWQQTSPGLGRFYAYYLSQEVGGTVSHSIRSDELAIARYAVAVSFDGSGLNMWINGIPVVASGSPTITEIFADTALNFGYNNGLDPLATVFSGTLADVRVWNIARTEADIIADVGETLVGDETGLVGYWAFNQANPQQDESSNANSAIFGTLANQVDAADPQLDELAPINQLNQEPGGSIELRWRIKNNGQIGITGAVTDGVYLSDDAILDGTDTLLTSHARSSGFQLAIGEEAIAYDQITLPQNVSDGIYYLLVQTDDNDLWLESNENNNWLSSAFTVENLLPADVNFTASASGSVPTSINVDWSAYDEAANFVASYTLYISQTAYTDTTNATVVSSLPVGTTSYEITGLNFAETYYVAVVATDQQGAASTIVTPVSVTLVEDTFPPEEVNAASTNVQPASITVQWQAPANTAGDLFAYRLYINSNPVIELDLNTLSYVIANPVAATQYDIRISTVDTLGNESAGVNLTAATALDNPATVTVGPTDSRLVVSWSSVTPAALVDRYAVYLETSDFTDVSALTAVAHSNGNSVQLNNLENGTNYYVAVVTINNSGVSNMAVSTQLSSPIADTISPTITSVEYDGVTLTGGSQLTKSGNVVVVATDANDIGQFDVLIDDLVVASDLDFGNGLSGFVDIDAITDGSHVLSVIVGDTRGNTTRQDFNVTVTLAPPAAPVIQSPQHGLVTNANAITLSGESDPNATVSILRGGISLQTGIVVEANRQFEVSVLLLEGTNNFTAIASNRSSDSAVSGVVAVIRDTSLPAPPFGLTASSQSQGGVILDWTASDDNGVTGYRLYRASQTFDNTSQATQIGGNLITANRFEDLPPADGTYYYRVASVNGLGTEGLLSTQVAVTVDSTAPIALLMEYTPTGNVDPVSGAISQGIVEVHIEFNETLANTPFLSMSPASGVPLSVNLSNVSPGIYSGYFVITENTGTGTAWAVLAAHDLAGNRGTVINVGNSIEIDAAGPKIASLSTNPVTPVANSQASPTTIAVDFALDEAVKVGTVPELKYHLSSDPDTHISISDVQLVSGTNWQANFTLAADAGLLEADTLTFTYSASDALDNVGIDIEVPHSLQVYQGSLPPLETPYYLQATARPDGIVELFWPAVIDAASYELYRMAPGETQLTYLLRLNALTYNDATVVDGDYQYSVASVRIANATEALSGTTDPVAVYADGTTPSQPQSLQLSVSGGILAQWQPPLDESEGLTYNLYRDVGNGAIDISGLTAIVSGIKANSQQQLFAFDATPDSNSAVYAVTAVDAAGNESVASAPAYLNIDLLPVTNLTVTQQDDAAPVITWDYPNASIEGYNFYIGTLGDTPVNSTLLPTGEYTDTGFNGETREYSVAAVDAADQEGVAKDAILPEMEAELLTLEGIQRGIMNQLSYSVTNHSTKTLDKVAIRADLENQTNRSAEFSLAPGETKTTSLVLGGQSSLPDVASLNTVIEVEPATGEQISIGKTSTVNIAPGTLLLSVEAEELPRGGLGKVRFVLENTSDIVTEIITADNANSPSSDLHLVLTDSDENLLSNGTVKLVTGEGVIRLVDGRSVARIEPGDRYRSAWVDLAIPVDAPDDAVLQLVVDQLHYHLGQADSQSIDGLTGTTQVSLVDTAYSASVTSVLPAHQFGDQPVTISGQAIFRDSGQALADVAVKIIVEVNGFERTAEVFTDASGNYSYQFTPISGESGIFTVSAIHPDSLARPGQSSFTIGRVDLTPDVVNAYLVFNHPHEIEVINATALPGTSVNNLRLIYDAADQIGGVLATGITVTLPPAVNLNALETANLAVTLEGDNTALPAASLVLRLVSDESVGTALDKVTINYTLSDASPVLDVSPTYIETGVVHGDSVSETVTLSNIGLDTLMNVRLTLLNENDGPAPDWLKLLSPAGLGDIGVGESKQVQISAQPDAGVADAIHYFKLQVESDNATTFALLLTITVTQSGTGNIKFLVADIYTATEEKDANGETLLDENDNPILIPGLEGARIRVQHETVTTIEETLTTDVNGEVQFDNLAAGRYRFRASAGLHEDKLGSFVIRPGITATQDVFLDYNLITVEWSVNEITIEDKYEIVLNAIFETDVPAAVVVLEPASTTLPNDMKVGEVFYGELSITNYGLVRADNLSFSVPTSDANFSYEFLGTFPDTLGAYESIVIPYRITALAPLDPDGSGSGAGCGSGSYWNEIHANCDYKCANGTRTAQGTGAAWTAKVNWSNSCGISQLGGGVVADSGKGKPKKCSGAGSCVGGSMKKYQAPDAVGGSCQPGAPCPDNNCCSGGAGGSGGSGGGSGGSGGSGSGGGGPSLPFYR